MNIPLRSPALFTDNPTWREFISQDPLTLRKVTWRFAREDRQLTRYAQQAAPYLHMPLLLMLAGRDRIVDNRRTRGFFHSTGSESRTLIEYPHAAHTLEFEQEPARISTTWPTGWLPFRAADFLLGVARPVRAWLFRR